LGNSRRKQRAGSNRSVESGPAGKEVDFAGLCPRHFAILAAIVRVIRGFEEGFTIGLVVTTQGINLPKTGKGWKTRASWKDLTLTNQPWAFRCRREKGILKREEGMFHVSQVSFEMSLSASEGNGEPSDSKKVELSPRTLPETDGARKVLKMGGGIGRNLSFGLSSGGRTGRKKRGRDSRAF